MTPDTQPAALTEAEIAELERLEGEARAENDRIRSSGSSWAHYEKRPRRDELDHLLAAGRLSTEEAVRIMGLLRFGAFRAAQRATAAEQLLRKALPHIANAAEDYSSSILDRTYGRSDGTKDGYHIELTELAADIRALLGGSAGGEGGEGG